MVKTGSVFVRRFQLLSGFLAVLVLCTGLLVLIGWAFDIPNLKSVFPAFVTMKANTAALFFLTGISLCCIQPQYVKKRACRFVSAGCAAIIALMGLLMFSEYIFGFDLGIDRVFFKEPAGALLTLSPGRMTPNTALNFMLISFVLLFLDTKKRILYSICQFFIFLEAVIALTALASYLYDASVFYSGIARYAAMALHTAVLFVITGVALFFARPDRGLASIITAEGVGGTIARVFLPVAVILPLSLGQLKLFGEKLSLYRNEFGMVLVAIGNITIVIIYVLWLVKSINRAEEKHIQAEEELRKNKEELQIIIDASPAVIFYKDKDNRFIRVNKAFIELGGLPKETIEGKTAFEVYPINADRYWKDDLEIIASGRPKLNIVEPLETTRGTRWLRTDKIPYRDGFGNIIGIIGFSLDITEQKQAERRIYKLNQMQTALLVPGTLGEKLKKVTDGVMEIFGADFSRIWLVRPGDRCTTECVHTSAVEEPHVCRYRGRCLHLVASSGRYTQLDGTYSRVPFGCYEIGGIASGDYSSFLTNDVTGDPRVHNHEWAKQLGLVSFAGFQLRPPQGETVGVLALFSRHNISNEEYALLATIGNLTVRIIQAAQSEEVLRESEEKFRRLFESSQDAVVLIDKEKGIIDCNPAMLKMFQALHKEELFGKRLGEDFSPAMQPDGKDSLTARNIQVEQAFEKGLSLFEWVYKRKDGSIFTTEVLLSAYVHRDRKMLQAVLRDITERKKAEEALMWETAFLEAQTEASLDGLLVVDNQGQIILINQRLSTLWKIPPHLVGQKDDKLLLQYVVDKTKYPQQFLDKVLYLYSHHKETSQDEIEFKDGTIFDRYSSPVVGKDGKYFGRIWTFRDITERKQTAEVLRLSELRYKAIFESSRDAIMLLDMEKGFFKGNAAATEMFGCTDEAEFATKDPVGLSPEYQPDGSLSSVKAQQMIATAMEKGSHFFEWKHKKVNGKEFFAEVLLTRVELEGKKVLQATVRDVTERKTAEEEIKNAYQKLKDTQFELTRKSKMAAIGQLAGGVAHEINNPLTGILNNVQLIRHLAARSTAFSIADFNEMMTAVEESAVRCKKITQSLLDFAHSSKGKFEAISLNDIVDRICILMEQELKMQSVNIIRQLQHDLPVIQGDSQLLQQVVVGLINNAQWAISQKSDKDGGTVTIATQYQPGNKCVTLSISDNGIGIPQENLPRMFEPFFTTREIGEGTGLGLALIYSILKNHNADIAVESQPGNATTFTMSFPL
ncbi:MAG: PAS domain S-box protein [Candidatus Omnitrophica bacterium]|nr:PAS domain S-box protein [Candidatus Omnitrophota bacterium]